MDLPPKDLDPNGRVQFRWRNEQTQAYKAQVAAAARNAMRGCGWTQPMSRARLSLFWALQDKRPAALRKSDRRYHPMDSDNAVASAKALIDGLTLSGAIGGDTWEQLELGRVHASRTEGPYVEVTLEAEL